MKDIKVKSYFRGNSLGMQTKEREALSRGLIPEDFSQRDEYSIDSFEYAKKLIPPFPRYYYWENVGKSYGIRQMGQTDGYDTIGALKRDQEYSFNELKISANPAQIWILKATPIQKIEASL